MTLAIWPRALCCLASRLANQRRGPQREPAGSSLGLSSGKRLGHLRSLVLVESPARVASLPASQAASQPGGEPGSGLAPIGEAPRLPALMAHELGRVHAPALANCH